MCVLVCPIPLFAQPQPGFEADVTLVRVPCVVTGTDGAPAHGLRSDDFVVLDDSVPQEVKYLWQELDLPLAVGVIAQGNRCRLVDQQQVPAVQLFSRMFSLNDRAFLLSVGRQQRLVTDWTDAVERIRAGTEVTDELAVPVLGEPCSGSRPTPWSKPPPCGETVLWNGVFFAARLKLRGRTGRKAMVASQASGIPEAITE